MFILRHHTVLLTLLMVLFTLPAVHTALAQTTITVTTTADNTDANDGACTLREALLNANGNTDTTSGDCDGGSGTDTIEFGIDGAGPHVITPLSALPEVTDPVVIDGSTQPGNGGVCTSAISARPAYAIVLDGGGGAFDGLVLGAGSDGSTIQGLNIRAFGDNGIEIDGSSGNTVACSFIGTDEDGDTDLGNTTFGILIYGKPVAAANNIIGTDSDGTNDANEGNLISGNDDRGIRIMEMNATGNIVAGNYIGTNAAGDAALPNSSSGVEIRDDAATNTIGGTTPEARNIISGNASRGVRVWREATNNRVQGNYIGTDATGTVAVGNSATGVDVRNDAFNNTIGGTAPGEGNLISGNENHGLFLGGNANMALGNYIGTDVTGTLALGNGNDGIQVNSADGNIIGGTTPGARNVVSGNARIGVGIFISSNIVVQGNYVGTNAAGDAAIPNGTEDEFGDGISSASSSNVQVGGPGAGNLVSGNLFSGITFFSSTGHIQGNTVGTNAAGTAAIPNAVSGIALLLNTDNVQIGGTEAGAGNLVSGNGGLGIRVDNEAISGTIIEGNTIGTNASGTAAIPNGLSGIGIRDAVDTRIGGTTPEARNLISGNTSSGILLVSESPETTPRAVAMHTNHGTPSFPRAEGVLHWKQAALPAPYAVYDASTGTEHTMTSKAILAQAAKHGGKAHATQGATNAIIQGNYIGTNAAGDAAVPNGQPTSTSSAGIFIQDASGNQVGGPNPGEGNLISGNNVGGLIVISDTNPATNNTIQGNYIGTNAAGDAAVPNGPSGGAVRDGIVIQAANNTIGGAAPGEGNLVSGNGGSGILLQNAGATGNRVLGNYIGTNAAGTAAIPNSLPNGITGGGVTIEDASGNQIGGPNPGEGNLISGNNVAGIFVARFTDPTTNNTIQGNYIGTNAAGDAAIPNGNTSNLLQEGIRVASASNNTIGGAAPGEGNLVSGNRGSGILIANTDATGNLVQGNRVGTNAAGNAALPNGDNGILIRGASATTIGGTVAGASNTIAFNTLDGVRLEGDNAQNNAILSNSIFENGALGIDLGSDGITANDPGDADASPNKLQNTPELPSFTLDGADNVLLDYFVDSNPANQTYPLRIEFFLTDADNQEGQTLFTTDTYSETDYNGCGAPPCPKTLNLGPIEGTLLVATATDADGNTSEFALPFATDFLADLELGVKVEKTESAEVVLLFSVQNHGTTASRPTIKIELPEGLLFEDADGPGSYNSDGGKWKPGTLTAGSSADLALTLRRLSTEELAISARITKATVPDPLVDNNSVVLVLEAVTSAQFSEQPEAAGVKPEALSATESLPEAFALSSNYPNPFNPETTIPFALPEAAEVSIVVYNLLGREVAVLVEGQMAAGRHEVQFQADALPSGLYLVRMQAGSFSQVRRMTLVK